MPNEDKTGVYKTVAKWFREERLKLGLSQYLAAKLVGVSASTYVRIENGHPCDYMCFLKICRAFDLDPIWLLELSESEGECDNIRRKRWHLSERQKRNRARKKQENKEQ